MGGDADATEFEWDAGNADKIWLRHRVSSPEAEQVFFNRPWAVAEDQSHSRDEIKQFALGRTDAGRLLFLVYTLRGEKVRIISAREMTRRERKEYMRGLTQELEANPEV